jgi:malonate-semialdehyde dehydrogenase (acetylating)/methylmalonate-semialdehyde dehydrogenase
VGEVKQGAEEFGRLRNYIGGRWEESASDRILDVVNPATGDVMAQVPLSTRDEVGAAVEAAQGAWEEWRETPPLARARHMFRLKQLMEENFGEVSRLIVMENGKTLDEARGSLRRAIENVEVAAGIPSLMMGYNLEDGAAAGIDEEVLKQPLGVFAAVCPFNFPVMVPFWFLPYAVATGNSFIVKPSEQVPLTMQRLMGLMDEAGIPPGVVNLVNGDKDAVDGLLDHQGVRGISFIGSTPVARYIYRRAAEGGKRVQCGGGAKNHLVVMPDANLDAAIPNIISSCYGCAGERCLAGSVVVTVGGVHEALRRRLVEAAGELRLGYGLDESTQMGPLVSSRHLRKVVGYVEKGVEEGAKLVLDGRDARVPDYPRGFFLGPCVFDDVGPDMSIAREEIFGPVVSLINVPSLDEAMRVVNSHPLGNAASIYTRDGRASREFRYRVRAGNIGINLGVAAPMAFFPFGGMKESHFGDVHAQGRDAVDFYTDRKVVITRWL